MEENQIFALRIIIEQTLEWNCPLHINLIDLAMSTVTQHRRSEDPMEYLQISFQ